MKDHKDRIIEFRKKIPPKNFLDREVPVVSRKQRRYANKKFKKILKWRNLVVKNGAGLPMDQLIRYYFEEFNRRLDAFGPESLPSSFNVMESFFKYDTEKSQFALFPEKDHIISCVDFIDFITSPDAPDDVFDEIFNVEDDRIHSYNMYDDPHNLILSTDAGNEYGFKGLSFVKRGDDVSVLLLCGKIDDLSQKLAPKQKFGQYAKPEYREFQDKADFSCVPLEGTNDMMRSVALTRYKIKEKKEEVRNLFYELKDGFTGWTNDPDAFIGTGDTKAEVNSKIEEFQNNLDKNNVAFEMCKMALLLPAYMKFKITLVKEEEVSTKIGSTTGASKKRPTGKTAKDRVLFRKVSSLRIVNPNRMPSTRRYSPPQFRVEVDGFWRRLDPNSLGKGPNNEPRVGKTWVKEHIRWRDRPYKPITVLVKSKISVARKRARQLTEPVSTEKPHVKPIIPDTQIENEVDDAEKIYVMVNPAYKRDIFKIGRTKRQSEERAKELSHSTGIVGDFLVAEEWEVEDCVLIERMIHESLSEYRMTTKKEFFKAPYKVIRKHIQEVIDKFE